MATGIITAALIVGLVGIFLGVFLGVAGIKFKVKVDEKEEAILAELPGNNCGGCGFAGCSGLAAAIAKGEASILTAPAVTPKTGEKVYVYVWAKDIHKPITEMKSLN